MKELIPDIEALAEAASQELADKNTAREAALGRCRDAIRNSANAIRAVHRGEFETAKTLADKAGTLLAEAKQALRRPPRHPLRRLRARLREGVRRGADHAGVHLRRSRSCRRREELDVELPAYLNGLGEAVGELRRYLLDILRAGEVERCEDCLTVMDEVYGILVTFDYPDAMTGGLRRTTDNVRGILERTRGDLSLAVRQRDLEKRLIEFEKKLGG